MRSRSLSFYLYYIIPTSLWMESETEKVVFHAGFTFSPLDSNPPRGGREGAASRKEGAEARS